MATPSPTIRLGGLARRLVTDGLLSADDAHSAYEQANKKKIPFVTYLIQNGLANAASVARSAATEFGMPVVDVAALDPQHMPVDKVDEKLVRRYQALPLYIRGKRLFVGISDPTNIQAIDDIKFHTGLATEPVLVEEPKLATALEQALESKSTTMDEMLGDSDLEGLVEVQGPEEVDASADSEVDEAPVVRFVNKVLLDAIKRKASDIHFEPYEKSFRVRFRQDGVLQEVTQPPIGLAPRIVARLKVMSRMDVSERRVPQDGRIKLNVSKTRAIDFRVNTCPTLFGEKVVLRILDPSSAKLGVDALGFEPEQKEIYMDALSRPQGMILVTGPTGSGKTVSLYTGLNILNRPDVNISTAEDPAEINLPGINQVNVNPKVGLNFADALRSFLRQDPDVIMVGEIRDLETAEIAVKAAQTGHLVLSTLHTNDAPQTLGRLLNMGVPAYNIASSVTVIIAQRLARRLCEHCKGVDDVPREALRNMGFSDAEMEGLTVYKPVGCEKCNGTGYKGRVGIYQVMPLSDEMGRIIMDGGNSIQLADQAQKEGISDLRQSARRKVKQGITSLAEMNRVTKD